MLIRRCAVFEASDAFELLLIVLVFNFVLFTCAQDMGSTQGRHDHAPPELDPLELHHWINDWFTGQHLLCVSPRSC